MNQKATHILIAKTAKEIAGAFYEDAAKSDLFYKRHPDQKRFIEAHWPKFVADTRKILATMLGQNNLPEVAKEEILDALIKDKSIPPAFRIDAKTGGLVATPSRAG